MKIPVEKAITDPAILVADLVRRRPRQESMISYMPHQDSAWRADWGQICKKVGLNYLDPADDIHETIYQISRSKFVIAEAMHAAIVADALRIPWVPVKAYSHILDFKWQDWAESLQVNYLPEILPEIWDLERSKTRAEIFKNNLKRRLVRLGVNDRNWTPPFESNNTAEVLESLLARLSHCMHQATPVLSAEVVHRNALQRTLAVMDEFASTITQG